MKRPRDLLRIMKEWDASIERVEEAEQLLRDTRKAAAVLMNEYYSVKREHDETT